MPVLPSHGLRGIVAVLVLCAPASAQERPALLSPTFSRDIAPIVFRHCSTCHRPGASAPFALLSYDDVRARARQIVAAVTTRSMPPWKATSGAGEFVGDRRLTDSEVALFHRWVDEGARQGNPADLPPPPTRTNEWTLGSPDLVVQLDAPYRLAPGGVDRLRNVVLPVRLPATQYVRAWEFRTTSPGAVHHATLVVDPDGAARRLDQQDPDVGYEGLIPLSAQSPEGYFLGWTPGQTPYEARDIAWRIDPGSDLVAMLHLRPTGAWESVNVSVALYFAERPPANLPVMIRLNRQDLEIPAGAKNYVASDSYRLPVDVELHGIQPHAHYLAQTVRADARLPDGTTKPLLQVPQWDFHWQDVYRYRQPVRLPAGTELTMTVVYDNSAENRANPNHPPRRVIWGQKSDNEMADVWLQVVPTVASERTRLVADVRRKLVPQHMDGYRRMIEADPDNPSLHDDLALLAIESGDLPLALSGFERSLRLRPEAAASHYNVGNVLLLMRRPEDAAARFRAALRLDASHVLSHQQLGLALAATGRIAEGAQEVERAVELQPTSADGWYNLGVLRQTESRLDEALACYREASRLAPARADARYAEGLIHEARGDFVSAQDALRRAVELRPGWAAPLIELAWTLAVSPDASRRKPDEALALARQAVTSVSADARSTEVLAAALAASGLFDEAVAHAQRALDLLSPGASAATRTAMWHRLEQYLARKPFVELGQPR